MFAVVAGVMGGTLSPVTVFVRTGVTHYSEGQLPAVPATTNPKGGR
jgi:hypothetical protein